MTKKDSNGKKTVAITKRKFRGSYIIFFFLLIVFGWTVIGMLIPLWYWHHSRETTVESVEVDA